MRARFGETAERDLESLMDRIAALDPDRAYLTNRALRALFRSIASAPLLGSPVGSGSTRKKILSPYCVLYTVRSNEVIILRIVHERSDWASLV